MAEIIGFVYPGVTCTDTARSILLHAAAYQIPVIAFSFPHLLSHFHGNPLIAERWDGKHIVSFETVLPSILDSEKNIFTKKNLQPYGTEFSAWLKKDTRLLVQYSVKKEAIPQILLPTDLCSYMIPTWRVSSYSRLLQQLSFVKDAILKPDMGRQGMGVCKLSRQADGSVILQNKDGQESLTEALFSELLKAIPAKGLGEYFLLQPCLDFSLDESHAVDFRLLRHIGQDGTWEETATYARVGASALVSNVSQGGFIADARETLQSIAGAQTDALYDEIMTIGEKLPPLIQSRGDATVFCLGMDIAIDRKTMRPFILEANTYPGTKFHARQLAESRAAYYSYLMAGNSKRTP